MSKLPSVGKTKLPSLNKDMTMQELTDTSKILATAAKQSREEKKRHHEEMKTLYEDGKTWALPSINPPPPKSPKSKSLSSKRRYNVDEKEESLSSKRRYKVDEKEESPTPTSVFLEDLYSNTGRLPTQAMKPKDKSHSQNKSSDATDPFEVKGSVASLLKSVREMKLGGKRTKKLRKTHKKTRKAKSHKNRRHSAKK